jgi:hypothetical protein
MAHQLARVLGFLTQGRCKQATLKPDTTNEVTERDGVLLVRLGRGSAMQVRLEPRRASVSFRIVPIAKATQLEGDLPWELASDDQLRGWIHSGSAIGRWLLAKG